MGLKTMFTVIAAATILIIPPKLFAGWESSRAIITGPWGKGEGQFDKAEYDTDYDVPDIAAILPDKTVLIHDTVNWKMMVFKEDGQFVKDVYWQQIENDQGQKVMQLPDYWIEGIERFTTNGNFYIEAGNGAELLSATGEHLATYDKKPLELGVKTSERRTGDTYQTTIQYEDFTYSLTSDEPIENYVRDQSGYLYATVHYYLDKQKNIWTTRVIKYDPCGKALGHWDKPFGALREIPTDPNAPPPPTAQIEVLEEYGPPVIGPDGSIYCWKRTPDTYSILKWTWVDSPDDPKPGPDAPANLKFTPSLDGLYLTWGASPQDPGCVDGYELERATSTNGIYTTVTTTDPSVLKFNDTGALPGTTYFYKVRAKSGSDYSPYTAEVSGTRIQ